jgi:hypothetical protein
MNRTALLILATILCFASLSVADDYLRIGFELQRDTAKNSSGVGVIGAKSQSGLDNFVFYVGRSPNYAWAGTLNGLGRLDLNSFFWDSYHADDGLGADSFPSLLYLPDRGRLIVHPQRCAVQYQVIFAYYGYGLRISDDEGQNWREVDAAPFVGEGACAWRMIENNGKLYAACWYNGLAHSEDGGESWAVYNIPYVPHPDIPPPYDSSPRLFCVAAHGNTIFAGTDYGIYRSQNGGQDWLYLGIPEVPGVGFIGPWIYDIYYDENGALWAACENPYYPYNQNLWYTGLAKSTDNGNTWEVDTGVLQYSPYILTFASSGFLPNSNFYDWFGTFAGVVRRHTDDTSTTYHLATGADGLPSEAIDHLFWYPNQNELWAGTQLGVAVSRDYGVTWLPYPFSPRTQPLDRELTFAYPNPFSPIVDGLCFMRVALAAPARVQVDIYDYSGQLVKHVYDGKRGPADVVDIGWDGRNGSGSYVANGTYFYQVKIDGKVKARGKVTVLQ